MDILGQTVKIEYNDASKQEKFSLQVNGVAFDNLPSPVHQLGDQLTSYMSSVLDPQSARSKCILLSCKKCQPNLTTSALYH